MKKKQKLISKVLEWRSNSISIFDSPIYDKKTKAKVLNLLVGTDTGNTESNYLVLLQYNKEKNCLVIQRRFKHIGNVIKVLSISNSRCLTASSDNNLYLYNLNQNNKEVSTKADLTLIGHTKKCTGMSLNIDKSLLLTSSEDSQACLWDINSIGNLGILKPNENPLKQHNGIITDVDWSKKDKNLFASCSIDKSITFYDLRDINKTNSINTDCSVEKIAFNYLNQNLFLSVNENNIIDLWDLRNRKLKLHSFQYHTNKISTIKWSCSEENFFVSASLDHSLVLWDLKKLENFTSPVINEDNPFESVFIYKNKYDISDFDWKNNIIGLVDYENNITIGNKDFFNISINY